MRGVRLLLLLIVSLASAAAEAGVVVAPAAGFNATWNGNDGDQAAGVPDNLALAANGATAFSSGALGPELGVGFHLDANVNDGLYGNSNSWIGGDSGVAPFHVGVDLGGLQQVRAVAWSRDNTDGFGDRALGLYTLQITTDASPAPGSTWVSVSTFDYQANDDAIRGGAFTSHLRHEYVVSTGAGVPIAATGVRLLVPASGIAGGTAVDELEVLAVPVSQQLTITPAAGFDVIWNGNDGDQEAGVPDNLALASNGAVAFSSGALGPELGLGFLLDVNANDGSYGNANSWIGGDTGVPPFHVGVDLGGPQQVRAVAWGRDNSGVFGDRSLGLYTLQITTDPSPGSGGPWTSVATFDYRGDEDGVRGGLFTASLRHEYVVSTDLGDPLTATGVRLLVPLSGLSNGTAIDELEVLAAPVSQGLTITPAVGFDVTWDGNDGDEVAGVPDNLALASNGALAFSSGDLGPELGVGFHVAANANDGVSGNSNAWIGGDAGVAPFHIGVDLGGPRQIGAVAWGRDNTAVFGDRALGLYTLQITTDAGPSFGTWTTVATFDYRGDEDTVRAGLFSSSLRHEYVVSTAAGAPLTATAVRLLVPRSGIAGGTAIDELEVFAPAAPVPLDPRPLLLLLPVVGMRMLRRRNHGSAP